MTKIGPKFMKETYPDKLEKSDQIKGKEQPPVELPYDKSKTLIELPKPEEFDVPEIPVRQIIEQRTSLRKYTNEKLTLDELSWLLWATQGVKQISTRPVTLRPVPSAGARHAFETIILANNVEGLEPGLYRYIATKHSLIEYNLAKNIADKVTEAAFNQSMVKNSAVTFLWMAVPYRMTWRYVQRGYRYLHLDAGHVCQNLYLASEAIYCGTCAIAAYNDQLMNDLLEIDGEKQFIIYLAAVGKR